MHFKFQSQAQICDQQIFDDLERRQQMRWAPSVVTLFEKNVLKINWYLFIN